MKNKVAIAFLTKDRIELSKRTIHPLLANDKYDVFWIDGSTAQEGIEFPSKYNPYATISNITGGADTAVVYALTEMLSHGYEYVGLCENDVLLNQDWFGPTFALFERGTSEGLSVGAVSSRAYMDRILIQRDGYAVMHNLGWGMQILTCWAAELTLKHFRTHWTTENRRVFARLAGIDIGTYWAFKTGEHWTCPDWGNDAILAAHGLASLALVPSPIEMIGQQPPLHEQGLKLADAPVEDRRNDKAFSYFRDMTRLIRTEALDIGLLPVRFRGDDGNECIFAHQLDSLASTNWGKIDTKTGTCWNGDWRLKWSPGLGGFAARGFAPDSAKGIGAQFECMLSGTARFMLSGGEKGGQVAVEDMKSGYIVRPTLIPESSNQVTQVIVPCSVSWRKVRLIVLQGSCIFYGIQCVEPQPVVKAWTFDYNQLWPV